MSELELKNKYNPPNIPVNPAKQLTDLFIIKIALHIIQIIGFLPVCLLRKAPGFPEQAAADTPVADSKVMTRHRWANQIVSSVASLLLVLLFVCS
jgi:hypothetical protein